MNLYCFVSLLSAFCFCNKTKWFSVCILWSCFLFCCFGLNVVFLCFLQRNDTANHPKTVGPSMLRNVLGPFFDQNSGNFALFCNCSFFNLILPVEKKNIFFL